MSLNRFEMFIVIWSYQTADVLITMEVPFPDTMAEFYLNYFCDNIKD